MSTSDGTVKGIQKIIDNGDDALRWNVVILSEGYQDSELATFSTDAQQFATTLSTTAPFDTLWTGINVHAVSVSSTDSGAADPVNCGDHSTGSGAAPHTYFDAKFCGDGAIRRLLTVDTASALSVATAQLGRAPGVTFVMVNSTQYGGSGATGVAVFSKAPGASGQVGMHEMGHSVFGLADEYGTYAGCTINETGHDTYTGTEPTEPNVTANITTLKWQSLVTTHTIPTSTNPDCTKCGDTGASPAAAGTVGAFTGARYFHCGLYRPEFDCRMRTVGGTQGFCAVCRNVIITLVKPFVPPTVTGISPSQGPETGGTAVTIIGTGFTGATSVGFGVTGALTLKVDSDTQITTTSTAGTGTVDVTVITKAGTSPVGSADQFVYQPDSSSSSSSGDSGDSSSSGDSGDSSSSGDSGDSSSSGDSGDSSSSGDSGDSSSSSDSGDSSSSSDSGDSSSSGDSGDSSSSGDSGDSSSSGDSGDSSSSSDSGDSSSSGDSGDSSSSGDSGDSSSSGDSGDSSSSGDSGDSSSSSDSGDSSSSGDSGDSSSSGDSGDSSSSGDSGDSDSSSDSGDSGDSGSNVRTSKTRKAPSR